MPRFFGKKGPRGGSRAGAKPRPKKNAPRRRLQPALAVASTALAIGKRAYTKYKANARARAINAKNLFDDRVASSDNIVTAKAVVIGKQRKISFQEKVSRTVRPPLVFKRNYQFSAEGYAGRKAWFSMEVNIANSNDLQQDMTTYKSSLFTDTATADPTISLNDIGDGAKMYVDLLTEKIRMMNSSSNSITGKVHLFAHKRDNDALYGAIRVNSVNMMLYYSTVAGAPLVADVGGGQTVGNGWTFDSATTGSSWASSYNMPGSSVNATGVCASTDPQLSPSSFHIKDRVGFWFRKVSSSAFSLKPGQQINTSFVFNDLPVIFREEQSEYTHLAGISYSIVVEFEGGIVGSNDVAGGLGLISTGTTQLSILRESVRTLGCKNTLKSKILLQTIPLNQIALINQTIINSDTGVQLSGTQIDA